MLIMGHSTPTPSEAALNPRAGGPPDGEQAARCAARIASAVVAAILEITTASESGFARGSAGSAGPLSRMQERAFRNNPDATIQNQPQRRAILLAVIMVALYAIDGATIRRDRRARGRFARVSAIVCLDRHGSA